MPAEVLPAGPVPLQRCVLPSPVLLAPAGAFGFHHVESEDLAGGLGAVQVTLVDNFTVDEDEPPWWKGALFRSVPAVRALQWQRSAER